MVVVPAVVVPLIIATSGTQQLPALSNVLHEIFEFAKKA